MAASDSSHMKKYGFYKGQKPGRTEFNELQQGAYDAFQRVQTRFISELARPLKPLSYSLGTGAFTVQLLNNAGIDNTGISIDWESTTSAIDCTASDTGSYQGTTAPSAGNKRYILIAGRHVEVEDEFETGTGGSFATELDSTTTFRIYATTSSYATSDTWYDNAGLKATFDEAVAAGDVPLLVLERWDGTTEFASTHAFRVDGIFEDGPVADRDLAREFESESWVGFVEGAPILTPNAIGGQPGSVTVAGSGAYLYFAVPALGDGHFRRARIVKVAVPDETITLTATTTEYILRAKYNAETDEVELYFGTMAAGTFPNGPGGFQGPFQGVQDAANLGFPPTPNDIPLALVTTGSAGAAPTVETSIQPTNPLFLVGLLYGATAAYNGQRPNVTANDIDVEGDATITGTLDVNGTLDLAGAAVTGKGGGLVPVATGHLLRNAGTWDWQGTGTAFAGLFEGTVTTGTDSTALTALALDLTADLGDIQQVVVMAEYSPVDSTQAGNQSGQMYRFVNGDGGGTADTVHVQQHWSAGGAANGDSIHVVVYQL